MPSSNLMWHARLDEQHFWRVMHKFKKTTCLRAFAVEATGSCQAVVTMSLASTTTIVTLRTLPTVIMPRLRAGSLDPSVVGISTFMSGWTLPAEIFAVFDARSVFGPSVTHSCRPFTKRWTSLKCGQPLAVVHDGFSGVNPSQLWRLR